MLAVPWPLAWLYALVVAVFHLTGTIAAIHALLTARSAQACIAWSISLITFPYVALPLYMLIGRNKFEGYVSAFRAGHLERSGAIGDRVRGPLRDFPPRMAYERPEVAGVFENLARVPFTTNNRATLLIDGEATYRAMFDAIAQARQYVLVMFFIVNDDGVGRRFKEALKARVQAGVPVVFVYDRFGSWWLQRQYLEDLMAAGVDVQAFTSSHGWRNQTQLNFRNHRKIVVVDGRVALVGGLNVGDEQLGLDSRYGPWRDTHLMIEGPAVQGVQLVYLEDYHWASGGGLLDLNWTPQPTDGNVDALYLAHGPAETIEVGLFYFLNFINAARQRLWIASPYFVPDAAVLEALKLADLRGVDVRILLPRRYDHLFMHLAALAYLPELETETGIGVYLYPAYNHQKVILVDDWLCSVGSANLDNRSIRLNFEGNMVMAGQDVAAQVADMLEADFARSERIGSEYMERRGYLLRLGARICRLFDPIL